MSDPDYLQTDKVASGTGFAQRPQRNCEAISRLRRHVRAGVRGVTEGVAAEAARR